MKYFISKSMVLLLFFVMLTTGAVAEQESPLNRKIVIENPASSIPMAEAIIEDLNKSK